MLSIELLLLTATCGMCILGLRDVRKTRAAVEHNLNELEYQRDELNAVKLRLAAIEAKNLAARENLKSLP